MARGETLERLIRKWAEKKGKDLDVTVGEVATEWAASTIEGWPVDTGYSRASIEAPRKIGYAHWQFRITADYARVIEYGGYRGVGPKTVSKPAEILPGGIAVGGGIFPSQRPSAPLRRGKSKIKVELAKELGVKV